MTISGTIRRMSAFVLAKRKPSISALHTAWRRPVDGSRRTASTQAITARKLTALHHSAALIPPSAMAIPASDGPMMRPRFHWALESPTAATRCSRGTRRGSAFWNAGNPNAPTEPVHSASTAMIAGVARPVLTTIASVAASTADRAFVVTRIRPRCRRSDIADPIGPSTADGRKPAAPTTAAHDALPVVSAT